MRVRASVILGVVLLKSFGAPFIATLRTEAQTKSSPAQSRISRKLPAPTSARLRLYEQFVVTQMKTDRIPGLTIGFSRNGVHPGSKAFGYSHVENKTPGKPESAYRLASLTQDNDRHRDSAIG